MEEIDISQLLDYFKSKIVYILFAMALAFCVSAVYVYQFRVPEYTSYTTVLLKQSGETISQNDINVNNSLVSTYSEIIKSKMILNQVISSLDLEYSYGELHDKINVGEVNDTDLIKISVTDVDNELAADVANTIADVFTKEIVDIYNMENISVIDVAEVSEVPSSASAFKIIAIVTVAGAFVALAVIFVVFYFDTTLKNEEEIEKITGIPVIGVVPLSREKIKGSQHRKYFEDVAKNKVKFEEKELTKLDVEEVLGKTTELSVVPVIEEELVKEVIDKKLDINGPKKVVKSSEPQKNKPVKKTYYKRRTTKK